MKIAIYAICKNEEQFAKRFAETVKGADHVLICDTGSTDRTKEIFAEYDYITVQDISVTPWRFDLARNLALMALPSDIDVAVSIDLDDIMLPGWREAIEKNWVPGDTTLLTYPYVHAWEDKEQTIPRVSIWGFKIHDPKTYIWQYPIHEILNLKEGFTQKEVLVQQHIVEHHPDWTKEERVGRIGIFDYTMQDYEEDPRMVHIYGRELYFRGEYDKAIKYLKKYLAITECYSENPSEENSFPQVRATTCRLIADCIIAKKGDINEIVVWYLRNVSESPSQREPWMWLAYAWMMAGDGYSAFAAANRGLQLTDETQSIEMEGRCWGKQAEELLNACRAMMNKQNDYYKSPEIDGWMSDNELQFLYKTAKDMGNIVEIGAWKGRSTHALLTGCSGLVYAVDHFAGSKGEEEAHKEAREDGGEKVYNEFMKNVGDFPNLTVLRMTSEEAVKKFKDKSIDMVFIDGEHTGEAVAQDIAMWLPKAKKIICGHDYNWPAIKESVDTVFKDLHFVDSIWYKDMRTKEVKPTIKL